MSERVEPISRRRGPVAPLGVPALRDDDDPRERERRRRRPPEGGRGGSPAGPAQGVTRDADGHVHVDVRA